MHSEVSPHIGAYRELLTSEGMAKVFSSVLDGQVLSAPTKDGRPVGSDGTLGVEEVHVHEPLSKDRTARALWTWIEVGLSLSRGQQMATYGLRFRIPWMSPSRGFLIGGWSYTPVVQLVPRPGLVVDSYDTPSGLARVVRADIVPERGRRLRFSVRRELLRTEGTDEGPLPVLISYFDRGSGEDEGAVPTTGEEERQQRSAAGSQQSQNTSNRGRRRTKAMRGDLEPTWFKAAFREPPRLGWEGRERFNARLASVGSTRTHEPRSEELVTIEDLNAVLACVRQLAAADEAQSQAGVHLPANLENLRALTVADHVRAGLQRALEDALDCVRAEYHEREKLRGNEDVADDGARDRALWERGFRGDEELLAVFERFAQASVAFSSPAPEGLVRAPGTPRWVRSVFADRRLVQLLDETNPVASLSHRRKVTRLGPGGVRPDRALRADRDLDDTHKGKLCPFETPESEDIGLVLQLSRDATIEEGTLKAGSAGNDGDVGWLGWSASLVPFLPHNDSARVLMAAKSMKQALPLREPAIPLVRTGAERQLARIAGVVPGHFALRPTAAGTLVGEPGHGDVGGPGTVWQPAVLDGELALGVNLRVAYMPFQGLNFEDGIVLSRAGAAKLTSRHGVRLVVKLRSLADGDSVDEVLHWGGLQTDGVRHDANRDRGAELNPWGVVKKGEKVIEGTELVRYCVLGGRRRAEPDEPGEGHDLLRRRDGYHEYQVRSHRAKADEVGRVTRLRISRLESAGAEVEIWLEGDRELQVGDKLTGRHGNKGVVTAVLEDDAMPQIPCVGAVDAVLNPIGALTRMNLGQLIETHLGWVARHAPNGMERVQGRDWPATEPIDRDLLEEWLCESAVVDDTGKVRVRLGRDGPPTELPVVVGYQYFMKLNHLAEKKAIFRSVGRTNGPPDYDGGTFQPPQGRQRRGGQRLGEMEMWALAAWNVPAVLAESVALKSDDLAMRDALRETISHAGAGEMTATATHLTESWRMFFFLLLGVGIRVELILKGSNAAQRPPFGWLTAGPVRVEDIEKMEVTLLDDDALRGRSESARITEPFAEEYRTEIELECGHGGIEQAVIENRGHCTECGRRVDETREDNGVWKNQPCGHTGATKGQIAHYQGYCKKCKTTASRRTKRKVRVPVAGGLLDPRIWPVDFRGRRRDFGVIDLSMCLTHELTGKRVRYVPVVPPGARTLTMEHAYRDLLLEVRKATGGQKAKERVGKKFAKLIRSFSDALSGKRGFVRKCLLGKRVDLSGRAVIVPDPTLRLDECGLPEQVRPYAEGRRVLLNRAPSLHRYNLHAFTPRFHEHHVISLHPALCGRFGADFDGDAMACHVVVGDRAGQEAFERMRPSRSLRSSAAGQPLVHLEQEALAGIAYLRLKRPGELTARLGPCGRDLRKLGEEVRELAAKGPNAAVAAMQLGFDTATAAGLSVGWRDIPRRGGGKWAAPKEHEERRAQAEAWTNDEVAKWSAGEAAEGAVLALLIQSGALRSPEKGLDLLAQLAVGRGRFEKLAGGETKYVRGRLADGLEDGEEWFAAAFGGRKGLADKKLVTPVGGALTRELVWVAEALVIGQEDCGGARGLDLVALRDGERELLSREQWGRRRRSARQGGIRSPVLCAARDDGTICRRCYGADASRGDGEAPETGYPIGLVAAQSVGERGTQLAMRTFHSGGGTDAGLASGLERVCALFRGQAVSVRGTEHDNAWTRVQQGGSSGDLPGGGAVGRRLGDLRKVEGDGKAVCDGLVRVFLFEMYGSYKAADVAPIHFEILLAALLRKDENATEHRGLAGVRQKAERRMSFLEGLGFGGVSRRVRGLAKDPNRAGASGRTLSRMLGRKEAGR